MKVVTKAEIDDLKALLENAEKLRAVVMYYPCELTFRGKTHVFDSVKDIDDFLKGLGLNTPNSLVGGRFVIKNAEFLVLAAYRACKTKSDPVPADDFRYTLDVRLTKSGA